jgi:TatD DNase family protein
MTIDNRPLTIDGAPSSIVNGQSSFVDTHCHLDLRQFDTDRDTVIARAAEAGVGLILNPAIDLDSCGRVLALAERYPNVYAAVGVHPNDCADFNNDALAQLRDLACHPKVVAIGEIGLDYYWNKVAAAQQQRTLAAQLALAAELDLPVILHSRSANGDASRQCNVDLLQELQRWVSARNTQRSEDRMGSDASLTSDPCPPTLRTFGVTSDTLLGVWHAFSGDLAEAQAAYDLGLVLGLGGPVTFQNARSLRALAPQLRLDRLMLETDAPYLAPHPHRGQRNEPAYIPLMAAALAQLSGTTVDVIAAGTTVTAGRCFTKMAPNIMR